MLPNYPPFMTRSSSPEQHDIKRHKKNDQEDADFSRKLKDEESLYQYRSDGNMYSSM